MLSLIEILLIGIWCWLGVIVWFIYTMLATECKNGPSLLVTWILGGPIIWLLTVIVVILFSVHYILRTVNFRR